MVVWRAKGVDVDFYESGHVDVLMLRLPGDRFSHELALALRDVALAGAVRIVDLLFVRRSADGLISWSELDEVVQEVHPHLSDLEGHLGGGLLDREDVDDAAHGLAQDTSVTVVVVENLWAVPLINVVRERGGDLVDLARVPVATPRSSPGSGDAAVATR